jgi:BirA family biotin operon repressor/biotin-[acetyl-CoA-carboxylase] ligase
MRTPDRILEVLYDRQEGHVPVEEIGSALSLSRKRVNAGLDALRERGHRVEISPAQGVRLSRPVRLDSHLIERSLGTKRIGQNVICFDEVGSTNDVAFDSARQARADGLVVLAESQRRGRGRFGRKWVSPAGANVLMSVLLVDAEASAPGHDALTIAAGVAVAEGVRSACGLSCELKWPNDVLLDGGKLAGVLVEVRRRAGRRAAVVGVGVNVNAAPKAEEIDRPATCLAERLGHPVERIEVVRGILQRLDDWIGRLSTGATAELHAAWMGRCGMLNQRVTVSCGGRTYTGRVLDVSPLEGLVLCGDGGERVHLPAGSSTLIA